MSPLVPPTRPKLSSRPPGTRWKRQLFPIWPVYACWWHPQFTARTAWCSERPRILSHVFDTQEHAWAGFTLISQVLHSVCTPRDQTTIPCSPQTQECQCVCGHRVKALSCSHCKTKDGHGENHVVEHHFSNWHMTQNQLLHKLQQVPMTEWREGHKTSTSKCTFLDSTGADAESFFV